MPTWRSNLDVDGEQGRAGAFVEIDFATMDQRRLAAKVARHRDYASDRAWWNRHPGCPALLLLTTSDARVTRFLANLERARPRPSYYGDEDPTAWEPVVAACACVSAPEEALSAPVWRTSAADAPSTLSSLLSADVRTYRRLVATVRAQRAADEQYRRLQAIHPLAADSERLADAMEDDEAAAAVRFLFDQVLPYNPSVKEEWAAQHLDLVTATYAWWVDGDGRSGWPPPPAHVVSGWRALYRSMWAQQATRLLDRAAESANDRGYADRPPTSQPGRLSGPGASSVSQDPMPARQQLRRRSTTRLAATPRSPTRSGPCHCIGASPLRGPRWKRTTTASTWWSASTAPSSATTNPSSAATADRPAARSAKGSSSRHGNPRSSRPSSGTRWPSWPSGLVASKAGASERGAATRREPADRSRGHPEGRTCTTPPPSARSGDRTTCRNS